MCSLRGSVGTQSKSLDFTAAALDVVAAVQAVEAGSSQTFGADRRVLGPRGERLEPCNVLHHDHTVGSETNLLKVLLGQVHVRILQSHKYVSPSFSIHCKGHSTVELDFAAFTGSSEIEAL